MMCDCVYVQYISVTRFPPAPPTPQKQKIKIKSRTNKPKPFQSFIIRGLLGIGFISILSLLILSLVFLFELEITNVV